MKNLKYIILFLLVMGIHATQDVFADEVMPRDTVYFYDSWEQMLAVEPVGMVVSPVIEMEIPYEVDIYITTDDYRLYDHQAASYGDSIWLVSGTYLREHFKGAKNYFSGYKFYPVFFNEKVAYVVSMSDNDDLSLKDILFGTNDELVAVYFYLDFMKSEVRKVTPTVLSGLLEDYHDLQMRYEGMKNYKKFEIIEDYFFKYIDRATQDFMRPYILDLTN